MSKILYIPNGPKNLATIFGVNFDDIGEYFIQALDQSSSVIATTAKNIVSGCAEDKARIHFVNYLGTVDAMNFQITFIEHDPKSDSYQLPTKSPLNKQEHSIHRFNVKSNDTYIAKSIEYREEDMKWIDELLDSPVAWMEWKGTQGQPDSYIPLVILDKKAQKQKEDDRYTYEVVLEFKLSHEKFILRN